MRFMSEGKLVCYKCLKEVGPSHDFVLATDDYGSLLIGHRDCENPEYIE